MGDRAVIALEAMPSIGVYLHWSGSPNTVAGIIAKCSQFARPPGSDPTYAFACLVQVCRNHVDPSMETGISVGVGPISRLDTDNGDNGLYWIGDHWEITRRQYAA